MKRLALLLLLSLAPQALADGYTFRNGYYWKGHDAYTRSWYQPALTYRWLGHYYQAYYPEGYYLYTFSHTAPPVDYRDPGWRSKLLDLAAQRDKVEGEIRKNAHEQKYFTEAIRQLGLEGNFRWGDYGAAVPGSGYGALTLSSAGAQGRTVYGYSYNTLAQLYGDSNLAQLYQQANRLAENSQKLAGQATTEFGQLVGQEGSHRARVAEILTKGEAVKAYLQALEGSGAKIESRTFTFKVEPGADGLPKVQRLEVPASPEAKLAPAELRKLWAAAAQQDCGACHSGTKKKGGFDLADYPKFTDQQKAVVLDRLTTDDKDRLMPRKADGGPGERLSADRVALWLKVAAE